MCNVRSEARSRAEERGDGKDPAVVAVSHPERGATMEHDFGAVD